MPKKDVLFLKKTLKKIRTDNKYLMVFLIFILIYIFFVKIQ